MKLAIVFCLMAVIGVHSLSIPKDVEDQILKVQDLLQQLKNDAEGALSNVQIGDKNLVLKYYGKQSSKPIIIVDDSAKSDFQTTYEHEFYHDANNHAAFTVSKFTDKDGKIKTHLRGTILEDGKEIVIEPHDNSVAKRDLDNDYDVVRVFSKPITGRLPTLGDGLHLNVPKLNKRQTTLTQAYVETLVICDFSCYNQHAANAKSTVATTVAQYVEAYLTHVMNLADLHYQRSFEKDTQLKVSLLIKQFVILSTAAASKFTTDPKMFMTVNGQSKDGQGRQYVNGDSSLNSFNTWLIEQTQGGLLPSFDTAVAFVYYNLFTPSADLLGIAPMAGTCVSGRNGVLVEDNGNYGSGSTTAHEVAHNLAVDHDINANSAACTDNANYVMSTSNKQDNRVNSFYFSSCSITSLKSSFITKKTFPCTSNAISKTTNYLNFVANQPGQLLTANEQCQKAMGPTAKLMVGNKSGGGTFEGDVCSVLWCTYDYNSAQTAGYAVEGTSCGDGKWCKLGSCVADPAAPKGTCLVDDDTAFCNDFLSKYGMLNVCNNFKTGRCCKMCGGTLITRTNDITNMLRTYQAGNVKFVDTAYVPPCVDTYTWCPTNIASWRQSAPGICDGGYTVNNEAVHIICKKSCNLC